jgi:predicted house-cleaning NTP pyrophosphatase (Maf/HAM1 superfamily)
VVVIDGEILEKPKIEKHAAEMLQRLGGRMHLVFTAVVFYYKQHPGKENSENQLVLIN